MCVPARRRASLKTRTHHPREWWEENARTIRSKRSEASGRCAKTPHVRFVLCFTAQTGLRAQNPLVFIGFREAVPGPPKRPLKRLPGARAPKTPPRAPKRPPRGPQEAPKRPQEPEFANGPCVFRVSGVDSFGIRYNGFCTLGSKTRPSVLQSGENARTIR